MPRAGAMPQQVVHWLQSCNSASTGWVGCEPEADCNNVADAGAPPPKKCARGALPSFAEAAADTAYS
eukprot:6074531-Pyramimonas_sp.AAC.1